MTASPASLPEIRAELAALLAEATPGPWQSQGWDAEEQAAFIVGGGPEFSAAEHLVAAGLPASDRHVNAAIADGELIVAARNALPGLLAALADAEAALVGALSEAARLREALERIAESYPDVEYSKGGHLRRDIARAALSARVSPAGVILTHDVCAACGDADHGNLDCDSCRTWQYQEGNLDDPREDGTAV